MLHCDLIRERTASQKRDRRAYRQMFDGAAIDSQDETSIMGRYRDWYLQISFSELHPLMVICLAKALTHPGTAKAVSDRKRSESEKCARSHAINDEVGCYSYRATHWLDTELDAKRFYEILDRCVDEEGPRLYKLAC